MIDTFFGSPRAQRRFFWLSAGVLAAGLAAFLAFVVFRGTGNAFPDKFSNQKAQFVTPEHHVPLTKAQLGLARKFIRTAVARKDLDASYGLVNVDLRGRLTRKQWDTGNIPVIDYPASNIDTAKFQIDYSYQNEALLEVDLIAKPGTQVRPELLFFLGLKRAGKKETGPWQVSYWEPHWKPPIPAAPN
jgi:hypothetical protein